MIEVVRYLYLAVVALPFLELLLLSGGVGRPNVLQRWLLVLGQLIGIIISLGLFLIADEHSLLLSYGNWISLASLHLDLVLRFDRLSALLLLTAGLLTFLTTVFSFGYMNRDSSFKRFLSLLILVELSFKLFVSSENLFEIWLSFFGYVIFSCLLTAYYYSDLDKVQRATRGFFIDGIGTTALLLFVLVVAYTYHDTNLSVLNIMVKAGTDYSASVKNLTWLFMVVLVCRCGLVPFHLWVSETSASPSPATALIQGGLNILLVGALLMRCGFLLDLALLRDFLWVAASVSMLVAAVYGLLQWNIKRLIAYIVMNRLSLLLLLFPCVAPELLLNYLLAVSWGLFTIYLGAAVIIRNLGDEQQLEMIGSLAKRLPLTMIVSCLSLLILLPFPGSPVLPIVNELYMTLWNMAKYSSFYMTVFIILSLAEVATLILTGRYFMRIFILKQVMIMPYPERGKLPVEMVVILLLSALLLLVGGNYSFAKASFYFPLLSLSWPLVGLAVILVVLAGIILYFYFFVGQRHYLPGHFRSAKHERLLNDAYYKILVQPFLYVTELIIKRFIVEWLITSCQKIIYYFIKIIGYLLQLVHHGNLRYFMAVFFLALLAVLYFSGAQL